MEAESVQPTLGIFQSQHHVAPSEFLVMRSVVISREACLNCGPLIFRKEAGCVGVVVDEPVCRECDNDGEESFLERD